MGIYKINKKKGSSHEEDIPTDESFEYSVGYTDGSTQSHQSMVNVTIDPDSNDCYAKRVDFLIRENGKLKESKRSNHYLKFGVNGFLYDPWGIYSEGTQHKEAKHAGKMAWNFRKVSRRAFTYYLQYLKSKNKSYLHNAEREVKNG